MILKTYKYIKNRNAIYSVLFQKLEGIFHIILFNVVYFSFNYLSLTKPEIINLIGVYPYDYYFLKDKV